MTSTTKILVIGIDGLLLQRAIDSGRATTLSLIRSDCYFSDMTIDMPTVSGPSWATLLTGVTANIHKVVDNEFIGHALAEAPDFLSRVSQSNSELVTYAAAGWPPLIDPHDLGPVIAARPWDQSSGKHHIFVRDGETHGYEKVDAEIAHHALTTINQIAPDVSFVYFCGADEAGHREGTIHGSYFDAIERIDTYLETLHRAIINRSQNFNEKWLLVITTDHGHRDEGGHGGDSAQERASFVIAHGVGRPHPTWPSTIKPEELVEQLLATL